MDQNKDDEYILERFTAHILQRIPLRLLKIPIVQIHSSTKYQTELLNELYTISQTNQHYVKLLLESLLNIISEDLTDSYYDLLSTLLLSKPLLPTEPDLIQYSITPEIRIKVWETPLVISGAGTTGFRTWEASLFLCEYFAKNIFKLVDCFKGLELGCGTGIVSMFLMKLLEQNDNSSMVYLTDGDSSLVEKLSTNLHLNDIKPLDCSSIQCKMQRLWWGEDTIPLDIDIIYAADVTYDTSVIPHLVTCLEQALKQGVKYCLIAATIRNEDTIKIFEEKLDEIELKWIIKSERSNSDGKEKSDSLIWYAEGTPDIRIYQIYLHNNIVN